MPKSAKKAKIAKDASDEADPREASHAVEDALQSLKKGKDASSSKVDESREVSKSFREWYVDQLTSCFGEEIDGLRKKSDNFGGSADDISNLVIALQMGESEAVFDRMAKQIAVASRKTKKKSTSS